MNILLDAFVGTVLGITLAAPPGPITSMIIRKATKSIPGALWIGFGAMTADFILFILTLIFHVSLDLEAALPYVYVLGAAFFVILSLSILRGEANESTAKADSFARGVSVGLINPAQIGWWLTAGLSFLETFGIGVFYFLFVGTTIWVLILSYLVHEGTRIYGEKAKKAISLASMIILLAFAGFFLYSGLLILIR